METVGYWVASRPAGVADHAVLHPEAQEPRGGKASWDAFLKDPAWIKAQKESEANGKIVEKAESVFLSPTDFSRLK